MKKMMTIEEAAALRIANGEYTPDEMWNILVEKFGRDDCRVQIYRMKMSSYMMGSIDVTLNNLRAAFKNAMER